jgi:CheY-like chemotaxis protein
MSAPLPTLRRILVVEDQKDAADSLCMLLKLFGHDVAVAYTGPDGVQKAVQLCPDVVVCDIGLPGLNGYGVAQQLRRTPATAKTRLIALTAWGQEEDRRLGKEAGFDHYLVKPADPEQLLKLLVSA